jgi:hypothetical protein
MNNICNEVVSDELPTIYQFKTSDDCNWLINSVEIKLDIITNRL